MPKISLSELMADESIPNQDNQYVPVNRFLAYEDIEKSKVSMINHIDAAGKGISKAIGSAPGLVSDLLRVAVDSMSGKGATVDDIFQPKSWTDRLNPFNALLSADRLMRKKIFDMTDLDERISSWADKQSTSNRQFIELGFPKQRTKALQFVEDIGAGSISLASAITMGMVSGPVAPGIAFGLAQKASGYKEALDKGKSYQEAQIISNWLGIFEGGLEFWGVHQIIRSGGGVIKRGLKGMLTEFIQEFSQETAEGTIKNMSGIEKQHFSDILMQGLYAGSIGAVLGGASAVSVASIQKNKVKRALLQAGFKEETAESKTNEIFNKAGEQVFEEAQKVLNTTYESQKAMYELAVKASSGEELSTEEKTNLDRLYDQFVEEGLIEKKEIESEEVAPKEGKVELTSQEKAQEIVDTKERIEKVEKERADIQKKIDLLYQGREKQLDQRRIAIEKEMNLLEKQERTKSVQNKLDSLTKELESIYYQIADLEETAPQRFEREGILLGGKDLEQLRKIAFRRGEVELRKELMAEMKAKREEKTKRQKAVKTILKQPKKPENIVDVQYQKKIDAILDKLGKKKGIRKKALNAMTTEELTELAGTIAELKTKGREVFASKKAQRNMGTEILRAAIIKQIGGLPDGTFSKGTSEEVKAKTATMRQKVTLANIRPLRFIREVFGKVGERIFYDSVDHSWTQKITNDISRQNRLQQSMKENKVSLFKLGKTIEFSGKQIQINKVLAMYIYQKDDHAYQMLKQGNNFTDSEVEGFIDIVKKEYPSYLKFADDVQQIVAERVDALSQVMETFYNIEMERVPVYFPLHLVAHDSNNPNLYGDVESYHVYEQVLRKGEGFSYTSPYKNMTISRKEIGENFSSEIDLNFLSNVYKAIANQEHLIAFAHLQKAFNKIINDKDIRDAVKYNYSEQAWKEFNEYLAININPHLMYHGGNQAWVRHIREGLAKAYLGFNAVTALKQFPSVLAVMKYTSIGSITKSMFKVLSSKEARERIYNLDPSLRNRVITRDFKEMMEVVHSLPESDIKRGLMIASKSISKPAFWMILNMDKLAVLSAYDSVYEHQRLTKSDIEAKDMAHKAVLETQPQGGIKDLPALYRENNEYLRMILMFTNQLNQYWNMATSDLPIEVRNKEYVKATTGIASMMIISTLIYLASHGRLPEEPDEFVEAIFGTFAGSVPIVGNIGLSMWRGYTPSISPADAILENVKSAIFSFKNEEYQEGLGNSLFLISVLLGFPYSQIKRTLTGSYDLIEGNTEDLRRLIWSEYMLESQ